MPQASAPVDRAVPTAFTMPTKAKEQRKKPLLLLHEVRAEIARATFAPMRGYKRTRVRRM